MVTQERLTSRGGEQCCCVWLFACICDDKHRHTLVQCLAHTEAVIDFGDDDREDDVTDDALLVLTPKVQTLLEEVQHHLSHSKRGEMVREGVRVALVGPPNAGQRTTIICHCSSSYFQANRHS